MEARAVLQTMLDRFAPGEITLANDYELHFVPMFLEDGPATLDVRIVS
jgi:hypothetical protein